MTDDPHGAPGDAGTPGSLARVLGDVAAERVAQDEMFGIQDFPDGTGPERTPAADAAKEDCRTAWRDGRLTWRHIFAEEFCEALAEDDPQPLRTELVQTAAVAVKWVQALDRRDGGLSHATKTRSREKLVRDRIPDIIRSAGKEPDVRVAADGEHHLLLRAKLYEEAGEFADSGDIAELADILEVVYAIAAAHGVEPAELDRLRAEKAARNGCFEQRHVLRAD